MVWIGLLPLTSTGRSTRFHEGGKELALVRVVDIMTEFCAFLRPSKDELSRNPLGPRMTSDGSTTGTKVGSMNYLYIAYAIVHELCGIESRLSRMDRCLPPYKYKYDEFLCSRQLLVLDHIFSLNCIDSEVLLGPRS